MTKKLTVYDLVLIGIFASVIAICSWIAIPMVVPFTLQTLGVFLTVGLLGGKRGTFAVLVYLLLGAVGLPVFAGFTGGIGILIGTTGGYLIGFLFTALIMWATEKLPLLLSMVIGLIVCYGFGTAWFMIVYTAAEGAVSFTAVLGWCVVPFIIPDIIKIALAYIMSKRLKRFVK